MARTIKEIALELLQKYKYEAESVIYWNGGAGDDEKLEEEVKMYRKEIEEADHESRQSHRTRKRT